WWDINLGAKCSGYKTSTGHETFNASSSELLDSIFNRLQKIVSQLTILGKIITPEELNLKFLRSLPTESDSAKNLRVNRKGTEVKIAQEEQ
ncbi:hypothetical protein Tco_1207068, partial [Tanacetum coccineum]